MMQNLLKEHTVPNAKRQGVVKDYDAEEAKQLELIRVAMDKVDAKQEQVSKKAAIIDAEFVDLQSSGVP